jgi:hypothetical protein
MKANFIMVLICLVAYAFVMGIAFGNPTVVLECVGALVLAVVAGTVYTVAFDSGVK